MESADWLNGVILKLWPKAGEYVATDLKATLEPILSSAFAEYNISPFSFESIHLGTIPPKVKGVRTYDAAGAEEVVMDLEIEYEGDSKIEANVLHIPVGVEDFKISGRLRVVMRPIVSQLPLAGGVWLSFLKEPEVNFNLTNFSNVLDFPGVSTIVRKVVKSVFKNFMEFPNRLKVQLATDINMADFMHPIPSGVLRIFLKEAKNLANGDTGFVVDGSSDPFCTLRVGVEEFRTPVVDNSSQPKFDFGCEFLCSSDTRFENQIHFKVYDQDTVTSDDVLLETKLDIQEVWENEVDRWIPSPENETGGLHVKATWYDLSDSATKLDENVALESQNFHRAVLVVWIDSAKHLKDQPDTFVKVHVGDLTKQTAVQPKNDNPVYQEGFTFLVRDPQEQNIKIEVINNNTYEPEGQLEVDLNDLLLEPKLEVMEKEYELGGGAMLKVNIHLRVLKKAVR